MNTLYFLDFDRTLFNNHEFFQDFSTILAAYFKIDGEELHRIAGKHNRVRDKATGIFSAFDMIREEYKEIDVENIKRICNQELAGRSYVFADVDRTLKLLDNPDNEIQIVTVGTEEYQKFKYGFTPSLHKYPFTVTQQTKGKCLEVFKDKFSDFEKVVLVDDRGDTFDDDFRALGIKGIRLNRVDSAYSDKPTPPDVKQIATLVEIVG